MADLVIHLNDATVKRLQDLAQQQEKPIEEVAANILEENITEEIYDESRDFLLLLAKTAEEEGWSSGRSDIAEHSREILQNEYPEDLKRRLNQQDAEK